MGSFHFLVAIKDQVPFCDEVSLTDIEVDDDFKQLTLRIGLLKEILRRKR